MDEHAQYGGFAFGKPWCYESSSNSCIGWRKTDLYID